MSQIYINELSVKELLLKLKHGGILHSISGDKLIYEEGTLVKYKNDGSTIVNASLSITDSKEYYFETEDEFEILSPGFYVTRDGRRAFVSRIDTTDGKVLACGMIEKEKGHVYWNSNGRLSSTFEVGSDLISKVENKG